MKKTKIAINRLQALARSFQPRPSLLQPTKARPRPAAGQLWLTVQTLANEELPRVVIMSAAQAASLERMLLMATPLMDNPAMAGPDDLLLPRELLGHAAALAVGLTFKMRPGRLAICHGRLPVKWLENLKLFHQSLSTGRPPPASLPAGIPYLDAHDARLTFRKQLAASLAELKIPACADSAVSEIMKPAAAAVANAWERVRAWCAAAGQPASWLPPEPRCVLAASPEQHPVYPLLKIATDGSRHLLTWAVETIPLPRQDAAWRLDPPVQSAGNQVFAILSPNSGNPLGYGRVNAPGGRLAATNFFSQTADQTLVLVLLKIQDGQP